MDSSQQVGERVTGGALAVPPVVVRAQRRLGHAEAAAVQ
jgi:hypothetical protein